MRNAICGIFPSLFERYKSKKEMEAYRRSMLENGFRVPLPPVMKTAILRSSLREHSCRCLVETGTYLGDTCWAFRHECDQLFTIEISTDLADLALPRFIRHPHVHVLTGDSSELLKTVIPKLHYKTLFWLDGHFSGGMTGKGDIECPLYNEIEAILSMCKTEFVILIDDVRCLDKDPAYPKMDELVEFVKSHSSRYNISIANDIMTIVLR